MPHTVAANGLTVSHKGTGGFEVNSTPDVCRVGGTPVPFSIISHSRDLIRGTTTVFADGGHPLDCKGSAHATCTGDEAGTGKGVISGTHLHESTWITWSPNVRAQGRNIARLSDKMFMNNRNCISGAGGHYEPPASITDPIMRELCKVFCEAREEWHNCKRGGGTNCRRPSQLAKDKLNTRLGRSGSALNRALGGKPGFAEKAFFASSDPIFEGARKIYDRSGLERAVQRQIEKLVRNRVIDKGVKMAARSWMKLVPGLNILSTAYDIVDTAITAVDIYDTIRNSSQIADEAVRIRPDFAIQNEDGSLGQIYDFKFDDPESGYQDDWNTGSQQEQAYQQATGQTPQKVDNATCDCDKSGAAPLPGV